MNALFPDQSYEHFHSLTEGEAISMEQIYGTSQRRRIYILVQYRGGRLQCLLILYENQYFAKTTRRMGEHEQKQVFPIRLSKMIRYLTVHDCS